MKLILSALTFLLFSSTASASACQVADAPGGKAVYVVPVYTATASYYFNKRDRSAFAIVQWRFDGSATQACLSGAEGMGKEVRLARLGVSRLRVSVFRGQRPDELALLPEQGGILSGESDLIPVPFSARAEIERAIARDERLVSFDGEVSFGLEGMEPALLREIPCQDQGEGSGVLALHRRLGSVIRELRQLRTDARVNLEGVLDLFMNACVELKEEDSQGFEQLLKKTRLLPGKIPVWGERATTSRQLANPALLQRAELLDI
jgi:hypothetical protein